MSFAAARLRDRLAELERRAAPPGRYVVAFSGGLDSTVLLHALVACMPAKRIAALHVDHGLQPQSADWAVQARQTAAGLGVDCRVLRVAVDTAAGLGTEAAAREARYASLAAALNAGDWLLSAHHRDDQAETLLQNLMRGSGPAGLAAMDALRELPPGWLARPLLDVSLDELREYADRHGLDWTEDPSNRDRRFDRNFLRHQVLPLLETRWPAPAGRLGRAARHAREASDLLDDLAAMDLASLGKVPARLPVDGLVALSAARQRNVLRYAIRQLGLPPPGERHLDEILGGLLPARPDAAPEVRWPGASLRRYRKVLYLLPEALARPPEAAPLFGQGLDLGPGLGRLALIDSDGPGLDARLAGAGLTVRNRRGGEKLKPLGQRHTRTLKNLLQEAGVVPWMRDRLPLLYAGERLVGVGDLWLAADAAAEPGLEVRWEGRPALH